MNRYRGEIEAELGGRRHVLCLTLGALAELEAAFAAGDLVSMAQRFETGRISAGDLLKIIASGLRGGGATLTDAEVGMLPAPDGLRSYVDIATRLLAATFGTLEPGQAGAANPPKPQGP